MRLVSQGNGALNLWKPQMLRGRTRERERESYGKTFTHTEKCRHRVRSSDSHSVSQSKNAEWPPNTSLCLSVCLANRMEISPFGFDESQATRQIFNFNFLVQNYCAT